MASHTSENQSGSLFKNGGVEYGVYRLQNAAGETFVDINQNRELCCRPEDALPEGGGRVCQYFIRPISRQLISNHL